MKTTNKSTLWANVVVDEFARNGIKFASISSGSRSTPLIFALAENKKIKVFSHIDERSASFFALGLALGSQTPVILVCTSGTAAANFYPAIIEAFYSNIPLIILTADRPHELRDSGANQTIDQIKMYGKFVKWFIDVLPPESDPDPIIIRYLRTISCRAVNKSMTNGSGPVHLNFPFRKPFEPVIVNNDSFKQIKLKEPLLISGRVNDVPYTQIIVGKLTPTEDQLKLLFLLISNHKRGLIICGARSPQGQFAYLITQLSVICGYPILAESVSGVRFGSHIDINGSIIIGSYDSFIHNDSNNFIEQIEIILQFGAMPISKSLNNFLENAVECKKISISDTGNWNDSTLNLTEYYHIDPVTTCRRLIEMFQSIKTELDLNWSKKFQQIENKCWTIIDTYLVKEYEEYFEGAIVANTINYIPDETIIFVSNSLPIRHLDQFVKPTSKSIQIFANRGVSGIDGINSTALGIALTTNKPVVLITGDLAFYHDLNGLFSIGHYRIKVIIVLINNKGGGIFKRLPISKYDPPFSDLILLSHNLNFRDVCKMYGLSHKLIKSRQDFEVTFKNAMLSESSFVLEVITNSSFTNELCNEIASKLSET